MEGQRSGLLPRANGGVTPYRAVTHRRRGLIESEIPPIHDNVQEEGGAAPYSAITCKRRDLVRSSGVGFRDEGNSWE
jgi:hypothetical protein